jgi:hypothetical protein
LPDGITSVPDIDEERNILKASPALQHLGEAARQASPEEHRQPNAEEITHVLQLVHLAVERRVVLRDLLPHLLQHRLALRQALPLLPDDQIDNTKSATRRTSKPARKRQDFD